MTEISLFFAGNKLVTPKEYFEEMIRLECQCEKTGIFHLERKWGSQGSVELEFIFQEEK